MESRMYEETARFQDRHWYFVGMREIVLNLFGVRQGNSELTILDVGCGTGQYTQALTKLGKVVGVDVSPEAIRLNSMNSNPNSFLIRGCAEKLPFPEERFDLVWATSIIEHLREDRAALQEIVRVLKPGGKVVISVPAHHFLWGHNDELAHHQRRYSQVELENLCRECRLKILRSTYYGATLFPPALVVRKVKNRLSRVFPKLKEITDFRLASFPFFNRLFLAVLRLENQGLKKVHPPFGMMLFLLAEKKA